MPTERVGLVHNSRFWWRLAGLLLAVLLVVGPALAQGQRGGGGRGRMGPPAGRRGPGPMMEHDRGMHRHGPGFIERLRDLPPEEQERVLANDERFRRLPAERQQIIHDRLERWNALSPEERQRIRERQEIFLGLSPAQRREARALFPQWLQLAPERRRQLIQAFRRMRDLPPADRRRFLSSPDMENRFSPEERGLLAGLSDLLPQERAGPPAETAPEPED